MVTREHIGDRLVSVRAQIPHFGVDGYGAKLRDDEEILTLALKALDTERDAALGKAVSGVLSDFGWDHAVVRKIVEEDIYAESVVGGILIAIERSLRAEKEAIAAHLRDEQKGGV